MSLPKIAFINSGSLTFALGASSLKVRVLSFSIKIVSSSD